MSDADTEVIERMTIDAAKRIMLGLLANLIAALGPKVVRDHLDEYDAAIAERNAAFEAKFHEKP